MLRRIAPAVGLFVLSPLIAEFLLGNIAIDAFWTFGLLAPLYGGGALLVRELARRSGRGWPSMILLALAFALTEEGLVTQSLFNPSYFGVDLLGYAYIPALGIGAWWTLFVLTLHTVWSVAVPIAIVEALVPDRETAPWLGRTGLTITGALFLIGAVANFALTYLQERFIAPAPQLIGAALAIAAVAIAAFAVARRQPRIARAAPDPRLLAGFSFLAAGTFIVARWFLADWPVVVAYLLLYGAVATAVARWSAREGWGLEHQLALAGGALLTYAWQAFIHTPIIGSTGTVDLIGNSVFALGAICLLAAAAAKLRRARDRAQAGRAGVA